MPWSTRRRSRVRPRQQLEVRLPNHRAFGDVANGRESTDNSPAGIAQRRQGVGGFTGLRDRHEQGVRRDHRIAITVLAGNLDAGRYTADLLDEIAGHDACVETGATRGDVDGFDLLEYLVGGGSKCRIEQLAAGDPLLQGLRDRPRLLVNLLEHEVAVLAAFHGIGW